LRTQTRGLAQKSPQSYLDQVIGWASARRHTAQHGPIEATPFQDKDNEVMVTRNTGGQPMLPGNSAALWC